MSVSTSDMCVFSGWVGKDSWNVDVFVSQLVQRMA